MQNDLKHTYGKKSSLLDLGVLFPPLVVTIDVHAARGPLARPKHGEFGPVQTRPDLVAYGPELARPEGASRAWASPQARGPPRDGPLKTVGP